jgi:hypothetical protein
MSRDLVLLHLLSRRLVENNKMNLGEIGQDWSGSG